MMDKKICLLLMMLLVIVLRSTALEQYSMKGSSALNRKEVENKNNDDDDANEKSDRGDDEFVTSMSSRRNRVQGYGSSFSNPRSRSRWSPPPPPPSSSSDDDSFDGNEWGRPGGFGLNNILSGLTGLFSQGQFENTPTCHSILDPQFTLFSDICGVVPQARYSLPNYFGHVERWQIAQALTTLLGPNNPSVANPGCARSLKLLICPLLFPPCKSARRELPPVLPCQPFCRAVKGQCPAPSLDLLPCDFLPPTSELCPLNPTPYSSLLSSFGSPFPMGGGLGPSGLNPSSLSSLLAQSSLSNGFSPMGALHSNAFPMNGFSNTGFGTGNFPTSNFQGQGMGAGGLPQFLQSGPSFPTQSSYQNYLPGGQAGGAGGPGPMKQPGHGFNAAQYAAESLQPVLVDFPPLTTVHDMRQAGRFFPTLRSSHEKA